MERKPIPDDERLKQNAGTAKTGESEATDDSDVKDPNEPRAGAPNEPEADIAIEEDTLETVDPDNPPA